MKKDIEVSEAIRLLLGLSVELNTEQIQVGETYGRVLAEDVAAALPYPPFDRSPFDGYAFRAADVAVASKDAPVTLTINQEIPAGHTPKGDVPSGFAAKILTGAPIPPGADAVVKFEDTDFTAETVTIYEPAYAGSNIVRAGEDIPVGTELAPKGTVILPALMGLLASQGLRTVPVYRKPVVAVLNTGTELAELGVPLPPGMIYNSSMYTQQGFLESLGADFHDAGVVTDDEDEIAARISAVLRAADMVITTGGASVGDYDCALRAAERAGGEILFWKVRMKPGGSLLAYRLDGKLVLSLSGNPGAAALGLLRLGLPYIRKLCGRTDVLHETCRVHLHTAMKKETPRLRVLRGYLELRDGEAWFVENEGQGGGDISSLLRCDLLAEIPGGSPPLPEGALVTAYRI
ncbi:MAG: molybdopterin molybdotransferase MoeA [Clostridiales Family XIII bacterium]|jgi:molybdopterin molybdotransferase|nr:molybdopterin molybdotransferase MoeA [Clostridiales Family XIII bacterium]